MIVKRMSRVPCAAFGQTEAKVERMYTSVSLVVVRLLLVNLGPPLNTIDSASRVLVVKASSWPCVAASAA